MPNDNLNLFALLNDEENAVRRIPLTAALQAEVSQYLMVQKDQFYDSQQKVEFTGRYNPDEGEIFCITSYPIPEAVKAALANPLSCDILDLNYETNYLTALFAGKSKKFVCFQVFDSRKILAKGFTLLHSGQTYKKLKNPGLTLQNKLTALYLKNELLFYSYHNTRRVLDLSSYYREATDADLDAFIANDLFQVDDKEEFKENADSFIRKKITLLQKNQVLRAVSLREIKAAAAEFGVEIRSNKKKLMIPKDKSELKNLLRFLDEDYFTSTLTKRKCLTNSKQYLQPKS